MATVIVVSVALTAMAILVMCSCRRVGAEPMPGKVDKVDQVSAVPVVDYIFELAEGVYGDIQEGECLVQQMCVSADGYEFYIFRDGSLAMMPWGEEE